MKQDIAPRGYLSIYDAVRILASVPIYSADDNEWLDDGDRLNDASAIDDATRKLRQRLSDGELTAYVQLQAGKPSPVPEWTWANDGACLGRVSHDERFRDFQFLHSDGIQIDGVRSRAFLVGVEFEDFLNGNTEKPPPKLPKTKRRPGRPKGRGAFNDEPWLDEMEMLVLQGETPFRAATEIVFKHPKDIQRKPNTKTEHLIDRLYSKYAKSDRPKAPPPSE
jgi:hypothetical protein